jgi:hypothetical protein
MNEKRKTMTVFLEPILNPYFKTYHNVLTISSIPDGPLADYVIKIQPTALSCFQKPLSVGYRNEFSCMFVLVKQPVKTAGITSTSWSKFPDFLMDEQDIPELFSMFVENGYKIDTELSRLLQDSKIDIGKSQRDNYRSGKKFLCMIHT